MSSWICKFQSSPVMGGRVVHIGRGLRLFFYCVGDCEALDEREEQTDFTLFVCIYVNINNLYRCSLLPNIKVEAVRILIICHWN